MIKSMTGFASLTQDDESATIAVAVRAVNHRFLDLQMRLPQGLAPIEAKLRGIVQRGIARGRLEVSVTIQQRREAAPAVELNEAFLNALGVALDRARDTGHISGVLSPGDLLRFPQALTIRERPEMADQDPGLGGRVEEAVAAAVEALDAMRAREGEFLRADLDARRQRLADLFEQVHAVSEDGLEGLRNRLAERVRELRADSLVEDTLIAQEIARFVGRSDITEETVRFRGHLEHWRALSDGPEPCGRKLDFLLQEMNREVNTAGSKAEGPRVSELIVELKAELERMREQVQNVE